MQLNGVYIQGNNELAKPIAPNGEDIYASNPYDRPEQDLEMQANYPNSKGQPEQQVIIIQHRNPQNERPADWLCFGEESLENRARMNFIRKVYMLLALQLLVTIGFCCLSYFIKPFFEFQMEYWWVTLIAIALMYTIMGVILCSNQYRQFPHNLIWLVMFTLCFSYMLSQVTSVYAYYYGGPLVLAAAGLTLFMVFGLTMFAIFSRNDLNMLLGVAIILLFSFGGFGILCLFTFAPVLYMFYCGLAAAILGILLIIDTKMIIGGQKNFQIPMDDYILGSLILYIDVMRLFLIILQLLGAARR